MAVRVKDFHVTGNLVDDPKEIEAGDRMLTVFDLAENTRVFDRESNQWRNGAPNYFAVAVEDPRMAENIRESLQKGQRVTVAGTMNAHPYVTSQGQPGLENRIWADEVSPSLKWAVAQVSPDAQAQSRGPRAEQSFHQAPASQQMSGAPADRQQQPQQEAPVQQDYTTWTAAQPGSGGMHGAGR